MNITLSGDPPDPDETSNVCSTLQSGSLIASSVLCSCSLNVVWGGEVGVTVRALPFGSLEVSDLAPEGALGHLRRRLRSRVKRAICANQRKGWTIG